MRLFTTVVLAGMMLSIIGCQAGEEPAAVQADVPQALATTPTKPADPGPAAAEPKAATSSSVLEGVTLTGLDGEPVDLAQFHGQVVMLVNVASRCGHTPQYAGLQRLHERYADQGLVLVGVPSNDFGGQEPGSAEQIAEFCQANFGVTFTMLDKVHVQGDDKTELYRRLTDPANDPTDSGEVQWNFEKFIVGRNGEVVARFRPNVQPESERIITAIEQALAMN
ncbi:glutathione peroxidase [Phycisphaerales bacterium AB-hyl4]|uniref:Glutathione peroxidase n=1 Tax=Natronomicrosphaera hydrolytica TaxID=3242702 RepID=A0ABV4U3Q9_9BACT